MEYSFIRCLHDEDGDEIDNGLFICIGENTMIKFRDSNELEDFAKEVLKSLPEIRHEI